MKKLNMMKGLLAGKALPHFAAGDMVNTSGQNPFPGFAPAGFTNALSTSPGAGGIGLAVPAGMGPTGVTSDIGSVGVPGVAPGAAQGAGQEGALSNMLMQQAQGQGPNPAQMMLNQATGKNIATQAALMAGQRGASANPALLARQAALQGAALQQNAAGQAATLGAEQQIAAEQQLQGLSAAQIAQKQAESAQNIGMQGNINAANAQLAGNVIKARGAEFGGAQQGTGAQQAVLSQGTGGSTTGSDDSVYQANRAGMAAGGKIGPRSSIGMHLAGLAMGGYASGGKVPAMVSPGEIYLPPDKAKAVAKGKASPAVGQKIPGKAKVKGDSLKNDTVKKTLDEGGVVVPRTKADDYDKAAAFVRAVMAKHKTR